MKVDIEEKLQNTGNITISQLGKNMSDYKSFNVNNPATRTFFIERNV